jgi:hypothetical protein
MEHGILSHIADPLVIIFIIAQLDCHHRTLKVKK